MRKSTRLLVAVLLAGLAQASILASPAAAAGGPVVLMGIDAEDGGPGGHGPISVYVNVVNNGILNNTSNGGTGILVLGGGKAAGDNVTTFWNAVSANTAVPVTYVNGAAIGTQSFAGFEMLAVVSSVSETPSGGLTQAENNALAGRQADIASFVNLGGGLLGFSQTGFSNPYAYLAAVGAFATNINLGYSNVTATPAGNGVGITNTNLDVCCWHDEYTAFPAFLSVLATNAATGNAAAIGGANVVVPTNITLTPASDTNPIGTPHTVTATVLDNNGNPLAGTAVSFSVAGPNGGATGSCVPANCTTGANGQVTFTYTGTAVGIDTIKACFVNASGAQICASASKTWFSPVTISINDVSVNEGDAGLTPATFTVSLSQPAPAAGVTVLASTANQTATAPSDYQAQANALVSFAAGDTSKPFTVQVVGDLVNEPDETFLVNLSSPTNATIADGRGVGTIVDDERDGAFSCRASALRVTGLANAEPAIANPGNSPCVDHAITVLTATHTSASVNVSSRTLNASTDQTPDNLEPTAPAATDNAVATASVERATVSSTSLVPLTINAVGVHSQARVQCTVGPGGLVPALTSDSTIASLTINGVPVIVPKGSATINLPLGGTVQLNQESTTPNSITRTAIRIEIGGQVVVIGEARANFSGTPCSQ